MNIHDDLCSVSETLCQRLATRILDTIGEDGPVVAIFDGSGNWWSSDEKRFGPVARQRQLLDSFCWHIGDGCEPVIGSIDGWELVGAQLRTETTHAAYVLIALEGFERDSTLANMPIIEMLLKQINVIAGLIDQNNQLQLHSLRHLSQTAAN